MNEDSILPPTREQARASLAAVDQVLAQTRLAIARGASAPLLILWGGIWLVADLTTQFDPQAMQWLWAVLDVVGFVGSWWLVARNRVNVKQPGGWRIGLIWGILFFYAYLWLYMLVPLHWPQTAQQWNDFEPTYRRITAYGHTIPMFAYVMGGLWFGRFFVLLGITVTVLVVLCLYFNPQYYYLWLAISGGGSLVLSGLYILKFWK